MTCCSSIKSLKVKHVGHLAYGSTVLHGEEVESPWPSGGQALYKKRDRGLTNVNPDLL